MKNIKLTDNQFNIIVKIQQELNFLNERTQLVQSHLNDALSLIGVENIKDGIELNPVTKELIIK